MWLARVCIYTFAYADVIMSMFMLMVKGKVMIQEC